MDEKLLMEQIKTYQTKWNKDTRDQWLQNAIANVGLNEACEQKKKASDTLNPSFSCELETGKVCAQKDSGRCWLFATLNTIRYAFTKKYNCKDFQFSQNYLSFWDRIEKSNAFFEHFIAQIDLDLDSRELTLLLQMGNGDGGQFDNAVALIQKYGLVPQAAMHETAVSDHTDDFDRLLNLKLRKDALQLKEDWEQNKDVSHLRQLKEEFMADVYRLCTLCFGEPVETFDFEYRDEDKNFHRDLQLTPQAFYEQYVHPIFAIEDYVVLCNAPDHKYHQTYSLPEEDNIIGGRPVRFLNVELDTLKHLTIQQLLDGRTAWFGCDVLEQMDRKNGWLAKDLYNYQALFDGDLSFNKADRLRYRQAACSHAMTFTGVNLIDGTPNRWKVENSWGEKIGHEGYFVMDDAWFDDYVYEVVIHKDYLTDELKADLEKEPIRLPLWDSLA